MQVTSVPTHSLAAQPVHDFLHLLTTIGHLDLSHTVTHRHDGSPELKVELDGPDTALLLARNGELLLAIEHIAAKLLRLEPDQHDRISFDAGSFKSDRDRQLQLDAEAATAHVCETGRPFSFPPMTSRERRMLHLALQPSGLPTASSGENPRRFVVLYPMGHTAILASRSTDTRQSEPTSLSPARTHKLRNAFRPR